MHESIIMLCPPPHLHCPHFCNTVARLLPKIRRHPQPPFCMSYTIQYWLWQYLVKAKTFCGTVFPVPVVMGAPVPTAVSRWGLCPRCPGSGRCVSGVNVSSSQLGFSRGHGVCWEGQATQTQGSTTTVGHGGECGIGL